jgi:hypothetical protein
VARIRDLYDDPSLPFLVDANIYPGNSGGVVATPPTLIALEESKPIEICMAMGVVVHVQSDFVQGRLLPSGEKVRLRLPAGLANVERMDDVTETQRRRRLHELQGSDGYCGTY